jgi:hypothetical protein
MYKKILKTINKTNSLKKQAFADLYKSEQNPIKARQPHFIFSAENPLYPENNKLGMTHSGAMDLLQRKGYKVEEANGVYGAPEKSIIVHNPSKLAVKHLLDLSKDLGQESSIYSNGYDHELHYHAGPNADLHAKGQGTAIHKRPPENNFTTMADGTHFTHQFNFDNLHGRDKSMIKQDGGVKKSERTGILLTKNENHHPLVSAGPDTKLIHYSPTPNLPVIDPFHHGVRGIGSEAKQGKPEHPTSFYYLEDTKPEHLVTGGSQSKYITRLGHHKLYDVGEDPEGIRDHLRSSGKTLNPGIFTRDELDAEIKNRGYHGIYNSSLNDTMKNVVAMYHPMAVEKEMKIHPKDYEKATSTDHHGHDESLKNARQFAKDNGHPDGTFLHKLTTKFGGE